MDNERLRTDLAAELAHLRSADSVETTLLIHPRTLERFDDYCYFLEDANRLVRTQGLRGVIQIASFHPQFQFADAAAGAVENYVNRSPYPMLHLLREQSISAAADANPGELADIPKRNAAKLRGLGLERVLAIRNHSVGSPHAL